MENQNRTNRYIPEEAVELSNQYGACYYHQIRGGKFFAGCYKGDSTKAKDYFACNSEEETIAKCQRFLNSLEKDADYRAELKAIRKASKAERKAEYQIGDILYHTFGYDETHVEFYQIVEVLPASVRVRKIGQKVADNTQSTWCSEYRLPVVDNFLGEPELKRNPLSGLWKWDDQPVYVSFGR